MMKSKYLVISIVGIAIVGLFSLFIGKSASYNPLRGEWYVYAEDYKEMSHKIYQDVDEYIAKNQKLIEDISRGIKVDFEESSSLVKPTRIGKMTLTESEMYFNGRSIAEYHVVDGQRLLVISKDGNVCNCTYEFNHDSVWVDIRHEGITLWSLAKSIYKDGSPTF